MGAEKSAERENEWTENKTFSLLRFFLSYKWLYGLDRYILKGLWDTVKVVEYYEWMSE